MLKPKHVALIALAALVVSGPLQTMGLLPQTALGDASNSFIKKIAEILPGGASEVLQLFEQRRLGGIHISGFSAAPAKVVSHGEPIQGRTDRLFHRAVALVHVRERHGEQLPVDRIGFDA